MNTDGIYISQMGESGHMEDAPLDLSAKNVEAVLIDALQDFGFKAITSYTEMHGNFLGVWGFLIALREPEQKARWFRNSAMLDMAISQRMLRSKDGSIPLRYFDGATMMGYQFPTRVDEIIYCRQDPTPAGCEAGHGFNPESANVPLNSFQIADRGLYAKKNLPEGSYFAIDESVHQVMLSPSTSRLLKTMLGTNLEFFASLSEFVEENSFDSGFFGVPSLFVDAGATTFLNHACNGSSHVGLPISANTSSWSGASYSPFLYRNYLTKLNSEEFIMQNVTAGTEVLEAAGEGGAKSCLEAQAKIATPN